MHIVDLSLPINRHMPGIPTIPEYEKNPTRCRVTAALSQDHLERIKDQGLETADELATAGVMTSRLEISTHIGLTSTRRSISCRTHGRSTRCRWSGS